ncbi:MAG: DUF3667 domain-containing protein [Cyclobacteriaceae bacterium]|nr:DUF3667 domain-containing protein [Cyclobacteriaceae bacterium]
MARNSNDKMCLNCDTVVSGKFCSNCGQSIDTHRFQPMHVFTHDFLKKVFYFDKGLFYSIKELFTRPGHSVREYIEGKRVNHLPYFSLIIIVIIFFKMIEDITPFHYADLTDQNKEMLDFVEQTIKRHAKLFYLGIIPLYALFSFLMFRKAKLNYSEHFVINTFRTSAFLLMNIMFLVMASLLRNTTIILPINRALTWIMLAYGTWFYYQYFSLYYTRKLLLVLRSLLAVTLPMILVLLGVIFYLSFLFHLV